MTQKAIRNSMNTPIRYVTLPFRDRRALALLCYRNRAEITVLLCERASGKDILYRVKIA